MCVHTNCSGAVPPVVSPKAVNVTANTTTHKSPSCARLNKAGCCFSSSPRPTTIATMIKGAKNSVIALVRMDADSAVADAPSHAAAVRPRARSRNSTDNMATASAGTPIMTEALSLT